MQIELGVLKLREVGKKGQAIERAAAVEVFERRITLPAAQSISGQKHERLERRRLGACRRAVAGKDLDLAVSVALESEQTHCHVVAK